MSVRTITSSSNYLEKLVKLIPAEIIGAYLAIQNLVLNETEVRDAVLWISIAILFLLIPFYLKRTQSIRSLSQILVTMISFLVWVYAIGGIILFPDQPPVIATAVLILWTAAIPVLPISSGSKKGEG